MNKEDLLMFNQKALRSKAEIVRAINTYLEEATKANASSEGDQVPENYELMEAFEKKIERAPIPFLEHPFSAYEINITDIAISLDMAEYSKIVFDQEGEIDEATASITPDIVSIRAPYITVDEFAKRRNVKSNTVLKWLREGKLRNAEKRENGWHIAATQGKPAREFDSGCYIFESEEGDLSCLGLFPIGAIFLEVDQDIACPSRYTIRLNDEYHRVLRQDVVDKDELLELEKTLIASPNVIFQSTFTDAISEKVGLGTGESEDARRIHEEIGNFIESAALPLETRRLLKVMLFHECDEELFLSTIQKLGLEDALQRYLRENK